jgi:cardiolipin synthase
MILALLIAAIIILRVTGLILAADAVMTARTPQGSLAWALSLLVIPEVAVWLYIIFGSRRFLGYVKARRSGRGVLDHLAERLLAESAPFADRSAGPAEIFSTIERLIGQPPTTGNSATLLIDGEQTFSAIFEAIASAREYLLISFYMFERDGLGERFRKALIDAGRRGVRVYVIYAGHASLNLPATARREYDQAGVRFTPFVSRKTFRGWLSLIAPWRRFQLNFRNHRKIVVADGEVAFIGGHNVGDDYIGQSRDLRLRPWRDTHMSLRGPAVKGVQMAWLEDWVSTAGDVPPLNWDLAREPGGSATVQIAPTGPADELETCGLMFHELFTRVRKRLWIATPYFVPDIGTVHALQLAALRGVDVRIIIPENYDARLVWLSAFTYYHEIVDAGVKVFRYQPGFMHQKVALCDDLALVGSANIDNRSFRINFEISALVHDTEFTAAVETMLLRDLERCRPVSSDDWDKRSWWFRLQAMTARLMAPLQ